MKNTKIYAASCALAALLAACGGSNTTQNDNLVSPTLSLVRQNNCSEVNQYIQHYYEVVNEKNSNYSSPFDFFNENGNTPMAATASPAPNAAAQSTRATQTDFYQSDKDRDLLFRIQSKTNDDLDLSYFLRIYKLSNLELLADLELDFRAVDLLSFSNNNKHYVAVLGNKIPNTTNVAVYDVNNPANPTLVNTKENSGVYREAHYVSEQNALVWLSDEYVQNDYQVTGSNCSDTYLYQKDNEDWIRPFSMLSKTSLQLMSLNNTNANVTSSQIISPSGNQSLYLNSERVFLAKGGESSELYLFNINKNSSSPLELKDSVTITGFVKDQFSMQEDNGALKLFYNGTYNNEENSRGNHLVIYDVSQNGFKESAHEGPFETNEQIDSSIFTAKLACVTTSVRFDDPLTCFEVGNIHQIKKLGRLEFPGQTLHLQQIGDNLLFGIGSNSEHFVAHLFDISDLNNPRLTDQKILQDSEAAFTNSAAWWDYRALGKDETGLSFSIPVQQYNYYTPNNCNKQIVLKVNTTGKILEVINNFYSSTNTQDNACMQIPTRGLFNGNKFISLYENGSEVFNGVTAEKLFSDLDDVIIHGIAIE